VLTAEGRVRDGGRGPSAAGAAAAIVPAAAAADPSRQSRNAAAPACFECASAPVPAYIGAVEAHSTPAQRLWQCLSCFMRARAMCILLVLEISCVVGGYVALQGAFLQSRSAGFTFWGMLAARLVFLGMSAGQTPGLFTSIKTGRSSFVQCQDRPPPCQWPAVCKLPKSWTMEERAHLRQTWPAGRPAAGSRHPQRSPSARCAGEASGAQRRHLMMSGHAPSRHPAHESDAALEEQQNRPQGSRLADSFSLQVLQIITLSFSSPTSRRVESVLAAQEVRRQSGKGNGLHHSPVMRFTTVV